MSLSSEFNKNVILFIVRWNNLGFTVHTDFEGSDHRMEAMFLKSDHSVTGYYEMESENNMKNFIELAMPSMADKFDAMKMSGFGMR